MHPSIAALLPEIRELCRRHGVMRLQLFGSAARGDFDPVRSDVDFLVEWDVRNPPYLPERWWGLEEGLRQLLGRRIDLVTAGSIRNPRLWEAIRRDAWDVLETQAAPPVGGRTQAGDRR